MLTRLNLDLDSVLIRLPLPALCIRLPKDKNPLTFDWRGNEISVRCMLLGDMNDGSGISVLIDIGELMPEIGFPVYSYRNFRRHKGLTVENALGRWRSDKLPRRCSDKLPRPFAAWGAASDVDVTFKRESG
jgi:hypothetical protein